MSSDTVCRVCLIDDMNLNSVRNDLQKVYEILTGETYNKVGYPVHMCYICLTVLRKCHRFMETARESNNVLKQWYKPQNEMRVARPLYTYSISKADAVSIHNETIVLKHEIKIEEEDVDFEVEEVQPDNFEFNTDVEIIKTDIDEHTDYIEVIVESPNDNTCTDTVEDNNDRQTDPISSSKTDLEEKSSLASNLDDQTNIETRNEIISPCDDEIHPIKKPKHNETKSQYQSPKTSGETSTKYKRIHDVNRPHVCDVCECRFYCLNSLNRHKGAMHNMYMTKEYSCDNCNYKTLLKNNLESHLRTHTGEKPRRKIISPHFNDAPPKKKSKTDETKPQHQAPETSGETAVKSVLKKHPRVYDEKRPHICDVCECRFYSSKSLKAHKTSMHKIHTVEEYVCETCSYTTMIKNNLICHLRTHTGEKPFSCDMCDYKSSVKGTLIRHVRTHTGDKPYSCHICDLKFTQKYHLKSHIRTHTGEKPFSCEICERNFTQTSTLKKHLRHHTGEKPYSCKICDHTFKRKDHLETHVRTHTGEKPFLCNICAYKCTAKYYLQSHMKTHTGAKPARARRGNPRPTTRKAALPPE